MNEEVKNIFSVIWAYVPDRKVIVMTYIKNITGEPILMDEIDANDKSEAWTEMEVRVQETAEKWCEGKNGILDETMYFNNLEERFKFEPQIKGN